MIYHRREGIDGMSCDKIPTNVMLCANAEETGVRPCREEDYVRLISAGGSSRPSRPSMDHLKEPTQE